MGYPASAMGPQLRAYVEHQLLTDLQFYGVPTVGLSFDWSNPCQEGHVKRYLDGMLEEMSASASTGPTERQSPRDGWTSSMVAATPHSLFFGSSSGFAKEMLGVRSRVKQRSPGMSGSDCRTTAEMSVRLKQHTTPDGPGTLWLLDGDVHAVNPPKLDPYERSQVAAKTRGRQCHLRCSVNRLCHASGIAG